MLIAPAAGTRIVLRVNAQAFRQASLTVAPAGSAVTVSWVARKRAPVTLHALRTAAPRRGNGASRPSQFSSTLFCGMSIAVGWTAASRSLQSAGGENPSWSSSTIPRLAAVGVQGRAVVGRVAVAVEVGRRGRGARGGEHQREAAGEQRGQHRVQPASLPGGHTKLLWTG
jgi:hypothetical protein